MKKAVAAAALVLTACVAAGAQDASAKIAELKIVADTAWTLIAAMLVFFMNLGFACVESGLCRQKNAVNILSKNFIVFAVSSLGFWVLGWGLMFGGTGRWFADAGLWFVGGADNSPATAQAYVGDYGSLNWTGVPLWAKFFFQLVFCGTAATIVSGAVAERIKYLSFILFTLALTLFIYPIAGHWIWGGGWLQQLGFADFAGSTQVHSIGGWAALAGVIILGPRLGRYVDGKVITIAGHNITSATIGTFVLWFGWFGFNAGSTMACDPSAISEICVTTNTAAMMATLTATIARWLFSGKPDLGMTLNGCLAGLVAVTAPCAFISVGSAAIIGAIAGGLVVFAVKFFDKIKLDDPVSALSVHLVNGVFGTLCVGLFSTADRIQGRTGNAATGAGLFMGGGWNQLAIQLLGVGVTAAFVLATSVATWLLLKYTAGIRVSAKEEREGLDLGEHGMTAYSGFEMTPEVSPQITQVLTPVEEEKA
jgi:Amt family ammonium transporter